MNRQYSSICIPRIDANIQREYIYNKIKNMNMGTIDKMIEIPLRNDPTHKRVIITIRWNIRSEMAQNVKKIFDEKGSVKLVHDMPWYWKICPAR
jgi:ethanolamine ammonia-lyase large subunit